MSINILGFTLIYNFILSTLISIFKALHVELCGKFLATLAEYNENTICLKFDVKWSFIF